MPIPEFWFSKERSSFVPLLGIPTMKTGPKKPAPLLKALLDPFIWNSSAGASDTFSLKANLFSAIQTDSQARKKEEQISLLQERHGGLF
jgi:hypothetical protein